MQLLQSGVEDVHFFDGSFVKDLLFFEADFKLVDIRFGPIQLHLHGLQFPRFGIQLLLGRFDFSFDAILAEWKRGEKEGGKVRG